MARVLKFSARPQRLGPGSWSELGCQTRILQSRLGSAWHNGLKRS
ncbi:hypothetical protein MACH17_08380 [Phaeobacter inhibens]|nr:hypothetical protein MACH17_08380 [Phaeobacter inhibens]